MNETMGGVLRLRPGITVIPGDAQSPGVTWVRVNTRLLRLRGAGASHILAAIDGTRTLEEVAAAVGAPGAEVAGAVERLRRYGLLEPEGCEATAPLAPQLRALSDMGADAAAVAAELASGHVAIVGEGLLAGSVEAALTRVGVGSVTRVAPAPALTSNVAPAAWEDLDVLVAALDVSDADALRRINGSALALALPWLSLEVRGWELRVGPFFLPRQTACWTCLDLRIDANDLAYEEHRAVREALAHTHAPPPVADDLTPGAASVAAELAALEVVRFFASHVSELAPELYGAFADYSLLVHRTTLHRVLRLPRCPACGARAAGRPTVRAWMEPYGYRDAV